jgi:uroporphyrinogen decarboxylase
MTLRTLADLKFKPEPDFGRLEKILRRTGKPDRIPLYELYVNAPVMERLNGQKIQSREDTVRFYYEAGYDYVPVWPGLPLKTGNLSDSSHGYPIKDRESFEKYEWPDIPSINYSEFERVIPVLPDGMKIIGQTGGIFERAEALMGYEGLCVALADDRELVRDIFDRLTRIYCAMYEGMASMPETGAVVISDDMGFKTQTLLSPGDLREFVLPAHKKLAEIIHAHGKPCILHSCGNLSAIMDDIINDVGIDAKHSYEDIILPVTEAKKLYGGRIAVLGGFDVDRLCVSNEGQIREHVRTLLIVCGADGGYALGSGNSIADYVPAENYLVMLDEALNRAAKG